MIDVYAATVKEKMEEVIGYCPKPLRKGSPESPLGNLTGDALIWMAKEYYGVDADVSLYNSGGIRAAIPAGNITLGDPVTISITQGGASASSLTFAGDALPGTVYDQPIGVQAPADMTEALMRAKLTITNPDGATTNVQATTTDDWATGEDLYYYYNGSISANESVDFITAVTIPTSLTNEDANKTFTIDVVVETIQRANNAANSVWTTAPTDWLETYSPMPASIII